MICHLCMLMGSKENLHSIQDTILPSPYQSDKVTWLGLQNGCNSFDYTVRISKTTHCKLVTMLTMATQLSLGWGA